MQFVHTCSLRPSIPANRPKSSLLPSISTRSISCCGCNVIQASLTCKLRFKTMSQIPHCINHSNSFNAIPFIFCSYILSLTSHEFKHQFDLLRIRASLLLINFIHLQHFSSTLQQLLHSPAKLHPYCDFSCTRRQPNPWQSSKTFC